MSTCTIHNPLHTRERVARRAIAHPRTVATQDSVATLPDTIDREVSDPAASSQVLRRWSVAELIASATWPQEAA